MKVLREKEERTLTIHFSAFLPSLGMLYITAKEIDTTSYTLKHTHPNRFIVSLQIFGFCRADLFYDVEASDLETPKTIVTNCEVFNLKVGCLSRLCHDQRQTR